MLVDPETGAIDFSKSKAYNEDLCRYNLHRTRRAREVCKPPLEKEKIVVKPKNFLAENRV